MLENDNLTIEGYARCIDVEAGENLSRGLIETEYDLDRAIGILGYNSTVGEHART